MIRQILLYRSGALGDTLLTLGALDGLRKRFPRASLTLAARPRYAAPLLDAGRIDGVVDAEAPPFHQLYSEVSAGERDEMEAFLRRFDLGLFFAYDSEGSLRRRLVGRGQGRWILSPPFPPREARAHVSDWMVRALAPLGVQEERPLPAPLRPSPETVCTAGEILRRNGVGDTPFFLIHPGSGSRSKWAPAKTMAWLGKRLQGLLGAQPVLVSGPADQEPRGNFLREWKADIPEINAPRLESLFAVLAQASACLGCDSGVSHLAALCGTPTLALFGPASDPLRWAPRGRRAAWIDWERKEEGLARFQEALAAST